MGKLRFKSVVPILAILLQSIGTQAQSFLWDVDFLGFFDNREYNTDITPSQTFFGVRLSPEVGIGFLDNRHRLMAGASWVQPFGSEIDEGKVHPTVYYRYEAELFKMSFGMFPRTQLIETPPPYMQYDSIAIFRPNITGALFQYTGNKGYAEAYIDWTQMQTDTRREAFMIFASGRWTPNVFFAGGHVSMNHLARSSAPVQGESVMDHMAIDPYIGADFTRLTPKLDTLTLRAGYYIGFERHRGTGETHTPNGPMAEFRLAWKYIGLYNLFRWGGNMEPFYASCGSPLYPGDPFYQSDRWYNRTDIIFYFFRNRFVNCSAQLNFHILPESFNFQQQLTVRFNLNDKIWKDKEGNKNKPYLKNIY